jgi:hypothetical protein
MALKDLSQPSRVERRFIQGVELSRRFYWDAVRPPLDEHFPDLQHSAALIGPGSEVLGFDTAQSMDHDWGPRVLLFLTAKDHASVHAAIDEMLRSALPTAVCSFATNFGRHEDGTRVMVSVEDGPVEHRVDMHTVPGFFGRVLGFDPTAPISAIDWLSVPENLLRTLTAGAVYHDGLGTLEPLRDRLHYYPRDVWLYLLAAQWARIGQEEAFPGRCAQVGDEIGSRLVTARLVHDVMRLAFLMERTYTPYMKWLGSGFAQLACAPELAPSLLGALTAGEWRDRQARLSDAYEAVARMHNALGITARLEARVSRFHNRPYQVIHADRFAEAIGAEIVDPGVLALPPNLGAVDQFVDSTDALNCLDRLRRIYEQ